LDPNQLTANIDHQKMFNSTLTYRSLGSTEPQSIKRA